MKRNTIASGVRTFVLAGVADWFFAAAPVFATQGHSAPEGLYTHQFAHIFFLISMGILIYWLRQRNLVRESGWRLIQYAAMFFILWNLDTLAVHYIEEQSGLIGFRRISTWQLEIQGPETLNWLKIAYFLAKLDHLLCVPAMVLLYAGMRRILKQTDTDQYGDRLT